MSTAGGGRSQSGRSLLSLSGGQQQVEVQELAYFDAKGVAEVTRLLLFLGQKTFVDKRYTIGKDEKGGFVTPEFTKAKESGALAANMNRAPIMTFTNGVVIGQSKAMERFVCRKCGFMGSSEVEEALIDNLCENVRDIKDRFSKIRAIGGMAPNEEKTAAIKKWFEAKGEYHEWLSKLQNSLPAAPALRGQGFCVGNKLSYADVSVWHLLRENFDDKESSTTIAKDFAELCAIADAVAARKDVQEYLSKRPVTMF